MNSITKISLFALISLIGAQASAMSKAPKVCTQEDLELCKQEAKKYEAYSTKVVKTSPWQITKLALTDAMMGMVDLGLFLQLPRIAHGITHFGLIPYDDPLAGRTYRRDDSGVMSTSLIDCMRGKNPNDKRLFVQRAKQWACEQNIKITKKHPNATIDEKIEMLQGQLKDVQSAFKNALENQKDLDQSQQQKYRELLGKQVLLKKLQDIHQGQRRSALRDCEVETELEPYKLPVSLMNELSFQKDNNHMEDEI